MNRPISIDKYISVRADVCGGDPCFKGHRILVHDVLGLLGVGISADEILTRYYPQLSKRSINAALIYASRVLKTGRTYPIARS